MSGWWMSMDVPTPSDQWPDCNTTMKLQSQISLRITPYHIIPSLHSIKYAYIYNLYIYIHTYKKLSCIYMYTCVVCVCVLFGMQVTSTYPSTYLSLPIRKFKSCLGKVAWFHLFEPHLLEPNKGEGPSTCTAWVLKKVLPAPICI